MGRLVHEVADELLASHLAFDIWAHARAFFPLIMHVHEHTVRRALSVEKHTHAPKLPPLQLSSNPPIRQGKLADCDLCATLCLNSSPTACCNERRPVYRDYAFSLPLQLCLYFPSMDAEAGGKEDLMML